MITFKFEGGIELAAALSALSPRLSKRALIDGLTEAGEPIRKSMGLHARRRSPAPDIADNMVIAPVKSEDQAAVAIGPAKNGFAYGLPLEIGSVFAPAQPYARPAFDEHVEATPERLGDVVWRELAGKGISRPTEVSDEPVADLGLTRTQATTPAAFKGKQRQRKGR